MKVGITFGAFDLFHAGHVLMLQEADTVCDYMIVCVQRDPSVDRPEKNKPVQNIVERQLQVKGCRYVDEVLVYETEQDVLDILAGIQWDVRIIGEEYENAPYTGRDEYKDNPKKEIYYNSRQHGFSSSELRKRRVYDNSGNN